VYGVERAPDVPIRVVTEAQLVTELEEPSSEEPADEQDARALPHVERALAALRLVEPGALTRGGGATAELVDRVDGVYQDAQRGIALVDRGMPKDSPEIAAVLVHELVHAIQDDKYDLVEWQRLLAHDVDSTLALRSVSEGQATYAQFRVIYAMLGYDLGRVDLTRPLREFRARVLESAHDDPSPYLASFTTFPYAVGVGAAAQAWSPTGPHFDERQFTNPPLTTLQALGESYALDVTAAEPPALDAPAVADGYTLLDETRLGSFLFELFLHRHGLGSEDARAYALDWLTDRLWIYAGPDQGTRFLWELELRGSVENLPSFDDDELISERAGARLFVAGSDPPEFLLTAGHAFLDASK